MATRTAVTESLENGNEDFVDIKAVRNEFRVIEDAALAQRLQDEEFQSHYLRNKKDRGTARIDVKAAKKAYLEEVKEAGILTGREFQTLSRDSEWLASELDKRVVEEAELEKQQKQAAELQDQEYAQCLQLQERDRIEHARRRRLEVRFRENREDLSSVNEEQQPNDTEETLVLPSLRDATRSHELVEQEIFVGRTPTDHAEASTNQHIQQQQANTSLATRIRGDQCSVDRLEDSSNHRSQQISFGNTDGFTDADEAMRLEQEQRDEEYARRLQFEEERRQKRIIEERDRRLAIKIQKREAEEYRRRKAEREIRRAESLPASNLPVSQTSVVDGVTISADEPSIQEEQREIQRASSVGNARRNQRPSMDSPWELQQQSSLGAVNSNGNLGKGSTNGRSLENQTYRNGTSTETSLVVERVALPEEEDQVSRIRPSDLPNVQELNLSGSDANRIKSNEANTWDAANFQTAVDPESPRQFNNIAATIDPTFKRNFEDNFNEGTTMPSPGNDPNDGSSTSPTTPSRPVPVIQNVRRKKSVDEKKKRKSSEKCNSSK